MNNFPQGKPDYFIPLSSNALKNGFTGPSPCAFSVPKVKYSPETQKFVNLLMAETKLTMSQRRGFQALLRSGDAQDSKSTAAARRQEYLRRRVDKARSLGLEIPSNGQNKSKQGGNFGGGRRTFDAIKATGALDVPEMSRTYIPVNKEAEKARLSYKMAYGQEPSQEIMNQLMGKISNPKLITHQPTSQSPKTAAESNQERLDELIEEMKERIEFLDTMRQAKREKEYHGYMTYQIREKLDEVRRLYPEKVKDLIQTLGLERVDPLFAEIC